jgi:hypothetical protein
MQVLVREAATLPRGWRTVVRSLKEQYYDLGRNVVAGVAGASSQPDPELERATYGLFGMMNWVYGWYQPSRHGDPDDVARTLHRIAIKGLTGESA